MIDAELQRENEVLRLRLAEAEEALKAIREGQVDAVDRKQAEEKLRMSDERFRRQWRELDTLYRTAPVGMWLGDRECRFLRVNEVLAEINGYSVEAHIGKTVRELAPGVANMIEPHYQRVLATKQPVLDFTVVGTTAGQPGVVREWMVSYHPLLGEDGEVAAVSGIVREVTAQRQAERRLQESEALLKRTLDTAATGLVRNSLDLRYLMVNSAYAKIVGFPVEQIVGRKLVDVLGETAFEKIRPYVERVLQGERVEYEAELPLIGNSSRYLHVVYAPDKDGN